MTSISLGNYFRFILNQFRERLWVKPLVFCLLSIFMAFVAKFADSTELAHIVPEIEVESIETLLSIIASSMMVIATFSVASMVSAYSFASRSATPRAFKLVVADGVSQNSLSSFIGAFIFSIVAITAVKNTYFEKAGIFVLFILNIFIFGMVIITFVRWVDRIARLGRMGTTIGKVEQATSKALKRRRNQPHLCGVPVGSRPRGQTVFAKTVGYVQYIDIAELQLWAENALLQIEIAALPGTFVTPERPLAYLKTPPGEQIVVDCKPAIECFYIGKERLFDDDPRFGLVVLSEIAGRALSPAVNDPGTAIAIIGTLARLFVLWNTPPEQETQKPPAHDRVEVPELSVMDMFEDAFTSISRDGAGMVEVSLRLQKTLKSLASIDNKAMQEAAKCHSQLALKRAKIALNVAEDFERVHDAATFAAEKDK